MKQSTLLIGLVAFIAALLGVFAGRMLAPGSYAPGADIHAVLHEKLTLDAGQEQRLERLERAFATRRRALETEMRGHNRRLAAAIQTEHRIGPAVEAAIDATHETMGALQKATLEHVFAMRALLREDQKPIFDEEVTRALIEDHR